MTRQKRHICRLIMRTAYTATGFFTAIVMSSIAHDGLTPSGLLLPMQDRPLLAAATFWALAVVLDGLSSEPGHRV